MYCLSTRTDYWEPQFFTTQYSNIKIFEAISKRAHITHLHIYTHKSSKFNHYACFVTPFQRRIHKINITLQLVLVLARNKINTLQHHKHDNDPNPDRHTKHTAH
jgi:hypothetical protein